jgi:hydroxymethylbilane synthase
MAAPRTLRLGTRGSALAVAQSGHVAAAITAATGHPVELVRITTRGDAVSDRPLEQVGGKGLFTKEIEVALIAHDVDFAVHSMKDLPGEAPEGLVIAAIPHREDPRDVIVGSRLAELPQGAIVGTGSHRRRMQLQALRPDLDIRGIRGNVDTRIGKQRSGEFAAIVLAAAGLARLGRLGDAAEHLSVEQMIPAPGQGALAVQCRESDGEVRHILQVLHHWSTAVCVAAERAFLITLSGGCSVPAACHARLVHGGEIEVLAFYGGGPSPQRVVLVGDREDADALGTEAARRVLGV